MKKKPAAQVIQLDAWKHRNVGAEFVIFDGAESIRVAFQQPRTMRVESSFGEPDAPAVTAAVRHAMGLFLEGLKQLEKSQRAARKRGLRR